MMASTDRRPLAQGLVDHRAQGKRLIAREVGIGKAGNGVVMALEACVGSFCELQDTPNAVAGRSKDRLDSGTIFEEGCRFEAEIVLVECW
jgi:hypothetical protein